MNSTGEGKWGHDGITGLVLGFLAVLHSHILTFSLQFQLFLLTVVLQYYVSLWSKKKKRQGNYISINANHYMKLKVAQSRHTKVRSLIKFFGLHSI